MQIEGTVSVSPTGMQKDDVVPLGDHMINNVVNISNIALPINCINVLSKGLNFCITSKFDETQFTIDLQKAGQRNVFA